jgi:tRNA(fMet)-specific endonuclease VapC
MKAEKRVSHFGCPRALGYDDAAAAWHASERARLEDQGKPPSFVDGQIASIARVNALIVVTNVRHYERFEGLSIEDWRSTR